MASTFWPRTSNSLPGCAMTEPDRLPIASPDSDREAAILVAPLPDTDYGYRLPGRRLAAVTVTSVVLAIFAIVAVFFPQARGVVVPLCISQIPLLAVALATAIPLAAAGEDEVPVGP